MPNFISGNHEIATLFLNMLLRTVSSRGQAWRYLLKPLDCTSPPLIFNFSLLLQRYCKVLGLLCVLGDPPCCLTVLFFFIPRSCPYKSEQIQDTAIYIRSTNPLSPWASVKNKQQKWNSLVIKLLFLDKCDVRTFFAMLPTPFKVGYTVRSDYVFL